MSEMLVLKDVDPVDVITEISKCPIDPCGQRIVVKEFVVSQTSGGIFVPPEYRQNSTMQTNAGVVIAIGSDVTSFVPGDAIYYGRYSGAFISIDRNTYRVMNDEDVIGRIRKEVLS